MLGKISTHVEKQLSSEGVTESGGALQAGAEMAGTLKNVVAVAAGFVDGMGYGANTKAAIMREGLSEMRDLAQAMYPSVRDETFLESCGVADLVATCFGGRNRAVSAAWAQAHCKVDALQILLSCAALRRFGCSDSFTSCFCGGRLFSVL